MNLFLDTNIVIDFINRREPYFDAARLLMIAGRVGEYNLWIAASQITDIVYVASDGGKRNRISDVLRRMRALRLIINVIPVTESDVDSMLASSWDDPEDALLFELAIKQHVDAIITRDDDFRKATKDSGLSAIAVFNCVEFFEWLEAEHGIMYANIPVFRDDT